MPAVTRLFATLALPLAVAACAETEFLIHGTKELTGLDDSSVARTRGDYKVGRPYQIAGTWYYPAEDFEYVESGIASWYGPKFHGRQTANGETFDMNALTAAHRTLPMPSLVRVINLENGRALMLRVNDRGPFARGRIIDVSRRAAQLLGFQRTGTARVRVQIMADESRRLKLVALNGGTPGDGVGGAMPASGNPAAGSTGPRPLRQYASAVPGESGGIDGGAGEDQLGNVPIGRTELFVQAGAYVEYANASRVRTQLASFGPAWVTEAKIGSQKFYRVRVGPLPSVETADGVLERVAAAGFPKAQIIVVD